MSREVYPKCLLGPEYNFHGISLPFNAISLSHRLENRVHFY